MVYLLRYVSEPSAAASHCSLSNKTIAEASPEVLRPMVTFGPQVKITVEPGARTGFTLIY